MEKLTVENPAGHNIMADAVWDLVFRSSRKTEVELTLTFGRRIIIRCAEHNRQLSVIDDTGRTRIMSRKEALASCLGTLFEREMAREAK